MFMKKKMIIMLPVISAVMFSGCATLFGGGEKQTISVNSDKPMKGTLSYEDGSSPKYFTTPATLSVERKNKKIKVSSDSNEFEPIEIDNKVNGWFWVNILGAPGGTVISSTTDAATGSMWKYEDTVTVQSK
jgi:hypothetical protein